MKGQEVQEVQEELLDLLLLLELIWSQTGVHEAPVFLLKLFKANERQQENTSQTSMPKHQ